MYAISFWGGLQIMVLEMCGFRVLETLLGSSVFITGTLLTLLMLILSAGYYAGGLLSAKLRSASALCLLLALAGLYTELVTTLFLDPIGAWSITLHTRLARSSFLGSSVPAAALTAVLYGPPVLLTSMISPYFIGLRSLAGQGREADPGLQSGLFMSLSTIGSIAGTLLASYLGIPFFGVATSARSANAVLTGLALAGVVWAALGARALGQKRASLTPSGILP
jgi:hypothetical protein